MNNNICSDAVLTRSPGENAVNYTLPSAVDHNAHQFSSNTTCPHPGRTPLGTTEAPEPPITVQTIQPALFSRPGPVFGHGEGVFQPVSPGKYNTSTNIIRSDDIPPRSSGERTGSTLATAESSCDDDHRLLVYYQNVRGLRTKIDDFMLTALDSPYDVIVLTETWLDERIFSPQLFGDAFTVFRNDRNQLNSKKSRGGGVLIAVSTRWSCCTDPSTVCDTLEHLWVRIKVGSGTVSIGVMYLPPDRKSNCMDIENHISSLGAVVSNMNSSDQILQFGDYNQSSLIWSFADHGSPSIDPIKSYISAACSSLLDGFNIYGLTQINGVPNRDARLLDLVLTNEPLDCTVLEATEPLVGLDPVHPALEVSLRFTQATVFEDVVDPLSLDFRRADYEALTAAIAAIDWHYVETATCVDSAVDYFNEAINHAIVDCVPPCQPARKPAWSNARLRDLRRQRSKALRNYCKSRCPFQKQLLNQASNRYRRYNRYLYKRYVIRTQEDLRRNPKRFWSFVNSKRKESGLPVEMRLANESTNTVPGKCNLFAAHFKRAFNSDIATTQQISDALRDTPRDVIDVSTFQITAHHVESAIQKLKTSSSTGLDGIPSCVIKKCAEAFVYPLTVLYNASLQQCKFPTAWKVSVMFPVFKKGEKSNVENYRGITSLCACSKVFEIIINDVLFASCQNYISPDQHGFVPKRSVSTNLVNFVSTCLRNMDSGLQVDAVYTDLKAAFDRVDHGILLGRLEKIGMSASLVCWFRSYLTDRALCVKIGSSRSEFFTNSSGVPQGSNLGPLLFIIFINEIGLLLPPGCRLFYADDVKIYVVIRSLNECWELQKLIDKFEEWCSRNFLTLSIGKCSIISFSRKQKPLMFNYTIAGQSLQRVEQVRDLGVTLDCALTFRAHYTDIITKANRQLGFIFKISNEFRDPLCLRSLYCSLVRSILESAVVVWCPYHANWISRIESIQRKFVRYALRNLPWNDPLNLPPYEDRCCLLGLDTLQQRRFNAQVVFVAKILKNEIDSPVILSAINFYVPERQLRQRDFIQLGSRNAQYGQHDPIRFMCASFNDIFELFDFNLSTDAFRNQLSLRR